MLREVIHIITFFCQKQHMKYTCLHAREYQEITELLSRITEAVRPAADEPFPEV